MKTLLRFEYRKWLYSSRVWITLLIWCILSALATQQRVSAIRTIDNFNDTSRQYEATRMAAYNALLDSAEKGLKVFPKYESDPRNPVVFNRVSPRFAFFQPGPLNSFATGQSDVFRFQYVMSSRYDYNTQKEHASNGLVLLYGRFDISFLITFLLPLFIIAFNYNVLSSEKENGTLKILLSQGTTPLQLAFSKLIVSVSFFTLLLLVPLVCAMIMAKDFSGNLDAIAAYLAIGSLYTLFWHILSVFVNRILKSSAYNATLLLSWWLILVIVLPSLVNTLTEIVHPVPSRTKFITEYRRVQNNIERDSNSAVLDKYFFDHPELVKQDTAGNQRNKANEFYKASHVTQDKTQKALEPVYKKHDEALRSANAFAARVGRISPSVCMQQSLTLLAGQSSMQYQHFNDKIIKWRKQYLPFILQKLLQDDVVSAGEIERFRNFEYEPYDYSRNLLINGIVLLLLNCVLALVITSTLNRQRIQ